MGVTVAAEARTGASAELRAADARVVRNGSSAFGLDGWRIDVANMTGRLARTRRQPRGRALVRARLEADRERCSSPSTVTTSAPTCAGDGWHGAMNYAGFLRPSGRGCAATIRRRAATAFWGVPAPAADGRRRAGGRDDARLPRRGPVGRRRCTRGRSSTATTRARFRTVAGSRERQLVGIGLQMTTPGVPMIFAGDELGLEGEWGEDARRTMPWDGPRRGTDLARRRTGELIALRRARARAGARRHPLRARRRRTRSRTCARHADERLLCLAARRRTSRSGSRSAPRERGDLYGDELTSTTRGRASPATARRSTSGDWRSQWLRSSSRRSTRSTTTASRPSST